MYLACRLHFAAVVLLLSPRISVAQSRSRRARAPRNPDHTVLRARHRLASRKDYRVGGCRASDVDHHGEAVGVGAGVVPGGALGLVVGAGPGRRPCGARQGAHHDSGTPASPTVATSALDAKRRPPLRRRPFALRFRRDSAGETPAQVSQTCAARDCAAHLLGCRRDADAVIARQTILTGGAAPAVRSIDRLAWRSPNGRSDPACVEKRGLARQPSRRNSGHKVRQLPRSCEQTHTGACCSSSSTPRRLSSRAARRQSPKNRSR